MFYPKRQILDSFKLKEFADDDFRFDENGRKFSKLEENTVAKGEIAEFLLFPRCFLKIITTDTLKNQGLFGKILRKYLCFYRDVLRKNLQQDKNEVIIFSGDVSDS